MSHVEEAEGAALVTRVEPAYTGPDCSRSFAAETNFDHLEDRSIKRSEFSNCRFIANLFPILHSASQ